MGGAEEWSIAMCFREDTKDPESIGKSPEVALEPEVDLC